MIACPKCGATGASEASFCNRCGAPLAGGGPSALEQLIDQRAKAIVAEEKAAAALAEERLARERAQQAQRAELEAVAKKARAALDENLDEPPTLVGSCLRGMRNVAVAALLFGIFPGSGLIVHMFAVPLLVGYSPAGVVCPLVCEGCSPVARVFSWNFRGSWQSRNGKMGYAFVCENPKINVDKLAGLNISSDPLNAALQPYMLNSFMVWLAEVAICAPALALMIGPLSGARRRRRVLAERPALEGELARADAALATFDQPGTEPDRGYRLRARAT